MRTQLSPEMERARDGGKPFSGPNGAFFIMCPRTVRCLRIIVTDGRYEPDAIAENIAWAEKNRESLMKIGIPIPTKEDLNPDHPIYKWEHVSVSAKDRVPTYAEMCWIKEQFWEDDEWVVSFFPAKADHVNIHNTCLHLWRLKPGTLHVADCTDDNLRLKGFPTPPKIAV